MCSGLLPESPQLEYIGKLMAIKTGQFAPNGVYRTAAAPQAEHRPWEHLFDMIQLQTTRVEADLLSRSAPSDDIRSLLTNAFTKENHFNRNNLLEMM
jgi:hypothetical protein